MIGASFYNLHYIYIKKQIWYDKTKVLIQYIYHSTDKKMQ